MKFKNFYTDMHPRPVGTTLERRNNDMGYSPKNCYWATRKEQANNRNSTIYYNGKTVNEWSTLLGVKPGTLRWRLRTYGRVEL